MIILTDICPKSGLKREIDYIGFTDNVINKKISFNFNVKYYNNITNEFLGTNILDSDFSVLPLVLSNDNILEGIGEYDYWKGPLNDINSLLARGFNSLDSYISYLIMKLYFKQKN